MLRTKQKLMATAVMLVVSLLMMTTASFAWFTISTNPEITGMKASAVVNENLEIALTDKATTTVPASFVNNTDFESGENTTWGNLVDLTDVFAIAGNAITLKPAAFSATAFTISEPVYSTDGRVEKLQAITETASTATSVAEDGKIALYNETATSNKNIAYAVDYWVRSNVGGDLMLVDETDRAGDYTNSTALGMGSYLAIDSTDSDVTQAFLNNVKVVFVAYKADHTTLDTTFTPVVAKVGTLEAGTGAYADMKIAPLTLDAANSALGTNDATIKSLTANSAQKIRMFVYLDGQSITNADALAYDSNGDYNIGINVQFGLSVSGSEYPLTTDMSVGTTDAYAA